MALCLAGAFVWLLLSRRLKLFRALERKDPRGACLDAAAEYIKGGQIRIGILDAPCHALDPIDSGGPILDLDAPPIWHLVAPLASSPSISLHESLSHGSLPTVDLCICTRPPEL
ncbi:hypothetical protein L1887_48866 [Cichorium endivia]|nr:hypothetical protein L1887_48866 [Cichorium endivia]